MKNNTRIILIGLIAIGLISLLFFIVPITPAFIISYVFTIVAIAILMRIIATCGKDTKGTPQSYANIYIACCYIISTVVFSIITYIFFSSSILVPCIIHIAVLGVFGIIFLVIGTGSHYISKLDNQEPTEARKKFVEEKKNYWK